MKKYEGSSIQSCGGTTRKDRGTPPRGLNTSITFIGIAEDDGRGLNTSITFIGIAEDDGRGLNTSITFIGIAEDDGRGSRHEQQNHTDAAYRKAAGVLFGRRLTSICRCV